MRCQERQVLLRQSRPACHEVCPPGLCARSAPSLLDPLIDLSQLGRARVGGMSTARAEVACSGSRAHVAGNAGRAAARGCRKNTAAEAGERGKDGRQVLRCCACSVCLAVITVQVYAHFLESAANNHVSLCVCVCARACVCACVRVCMCVQETALMEREFLSTQTAHRRAGAVEA